MATDKSAPPERGGFFWDELDAASSARGDWRRDPGGYDDDAGDVS